MLLCIFFISFSNTTVFGVGDTVYGLGDNTYSDSTLHKVVSDYVEGLLLTLRSDTVHSMGNSLQVQIQKGKVSDNCSTGSGGVLSVLLKPEARGRVLIYKKAYFGKIIDL